jgi:hypothetical protein
MLPNEYLSERLMPHPLPTKDGGVLRTVEDARAYILTLPKTRRSRAHWKRASLLLLEEVGAAALTRQIQVALVMDGKLDPYVRALGGGRTHTSRRKIEKEIILIALVVAAVILATAGRAHGRSVSSVMAEVARRDQVHRRL